MCLLQTKKPCPASALWPQTHSGALLLCAGAGRSMKLRDAAGSDGDGGGWEGRGCSKPPTAYFFHQWDVASALWRAQGKHVAGDALPELWPMLGYLQPCCCSFRRASSPPPPPFILWGSVAGKCPRGLPWTLAYTCRNSNSKCM